jgi:hypothetical protein
LLSVTFQVELGFTWQLALPQYSKVEHLAQVAPPDPQASLAVPDSQAPALQQPFLQLEGPHAIGLLQVPCWQLWPLAHCWHAAPPVPHAVTSVAPPKLQLCPWQQPGQVAAEQPAPHCPFAHTSPLWHCLHAAPPLPQAASALPLAHEVPAQQPPGHDFAVQAHLPATHSWLEAQAAHGPPPAPHLLAVAGLTQVPLSQQPSGQLAALHPVEGVMQLPLEHT